MYGPLDRGSLTLGESPAVLDGPMGVRLCCWLVCLSLLYDLDLVLPCFHGSVNDVSLVLCFVILEFGFVFSAFSIAPPLCSIVCLCFFSIVLFTSLLLPLGFSFVLGVVLAPFSWVGLWAGLLFPCVCLCSWPVLSSIVLFAPRGCPLAYSRFPLF